MYNWTTLALPGRQLDYTGVSSRPYPAAYVWGAQEGPWGGLHLPWKASTLLVGFT